MSKDKVPYKRGGRLEFSQPQSTTKAGARKREIDDGEKNGEARTLNVREMEKIGVVALVVEESTDRFSKFEITWCIGRKGSPSRSCPERERRRKIR